MKAFKYVFIFLTLLTLSGCFAAHREAQHTMDNMDSSSKSAAASSKGTIEKVQSTITKEQLQDKKTLRGLKLSY